MAFKAVPKSNYDAGRDLLDQVPPAMVGAGLMVILLILAVGTFWFMKRHYAALRSDPEDLPPHL